MCGGGGGVAFAYLVYTGPNVYLRVVMNFARFAPECEFVWK